LSLKELRSSPVENYQRKQQHDLGILIMRAKKKKDGETMPITFFLVSTLPTPSKSDAY